MFNNQNILYFATITKTTAAFGTLFDEISIGRYSLNAGAGDKLKTIKVPLSYAATEKWLDQKAEDVNSKPSVSVPANVKTRIKTSLPRMSYEMIDIQPDFSRKLNTLGAMVGKDPNNIGAFIKQLNPVPYDYSYEVKIATKTLDDGFQIIEQILPNFRPSFNLTIKDIPELNITRDVPVIFAGITKQDTWEGSYEDSRVLTWTLSFIVKGYLYPNIADTGVIKTAIANIRAQANEAVKDAIVVTHVNPITAHIDDAWTPKTNIYEVGETPAEIDSNGDIIVDSNSPNFEG